MNRTIADLPKNQRERLRIELSEFRGHDLVSARIYADTDAGLVPTTKGITIRVALLPDLVAALRDAETEARAAGLI